MCVHARSTTKAFRSLAERFALAGLMPLIFHGDSRDYTMFVDPKDKEGVKRAYTDLSQWHPGSIITDTSAFDISEASGGQFDFSDMIKPEKMLIRDRNVPDSLDLEEKDFDAVYARCLTNGYFSERSSAALEVG